jgi:hypothetical protein
MTKFTLSLQQELQVLRLQAREHAGDPPVFERILKDISRVRTLIEWPTRVAQRGNIEPYRFR